MILHIKACRLFLRCCSRGFHFRPFISSLFNPQNHVNQPKTKCFLNMSNRIGVQLCMFVSVAQLVGVVCSKNCTFRLEFAGGASSRLIGCPVMSFCKTFYLLLSHCFNPGRQPFRWFPPQHTPSQWHHDITKSVLYICTLFPNPLTVTEKLGLAKRAAFLKTYTGIDVLIKRRNLYLHVYMKWCVQALHVCINHASV